MRATVLMALGLGLAAACTSSTGGGGDDGSGSGSNIDHGNGKLIPGGGVGGDPIAADLTVHVVETGTSTPISGASVQLSSGDTQATDSTGLASFTGLSAGSQDVTVTSSGHVPATWVGVTRDNLTIPLEAPAGSLPTAHVTGTIDGWDNLPSPSFGHYTLGLVLYSFVDDPSAPENSIVQPTSSDGTPLDTCLNTGLSSNCSWELTARVGKQIHTAVIVDGDTNGSTSDTSDDTYTLIGYAAGSTMTLTDGQSVDNETLAMVTTGTASLSVSFPSALSGLSHVTVVPELALGDAGRIVIPLPPVTPKDKTAQVLMPTGAFAGSYELVALATPSATKTTPFSSGFVHDVTGTGTIPAWLAPPTVNASSSDFSFTADGNFHTAQMVRGTSVLWDVTIVDGSTSFSLPTLSPDPLGGGSFTFEVSAADVPNFDAKSFDVPTVKATLTRASGGSN